MKRFNPLLPLAITFTVIAFLAGWFYGRTNHSPSPHQLTLEQILSIRELHLVKHTYTDLFFLHKRNQPEKAIRAMVQVPVTVTAYLNLKDIELIYAGDTLQTIFLPRAILREPVYHLGQVVVRETRSFQIHAGKDLYPEVVDYLSTTIATRIDTARHLAESNRIVLQAEAEGKEYLESMLHALGRSDIRVAFQDAQHDAQVAAYLKAQRLPGPTARSKENFSRASVIPFGFLPMP